MRGVGLAADSITLAIVLGVAAVAWVVMAWQMLGSAVLGIAYAAQA